MKGLEIKLPDTKKIVDRYGLGKNGYTQKFFSNELMRISDNFVPFKQGALKNSATIDIDGTAINYNTPYARVHWYGKVMVGSVPRVASEKDFMYRGAPMRGSRWVERAFASNKDAILKAVEEVAKKGGSE